MTSGLHIYPTRPLADWLAETDRFVRECRDGTADKRFKIYMKIKYRLDDRRRHVRPRQINRSFIRPGGFKKG